VEVFLGSVAESEAGAGGSAQAMLTSENMLKTELKMVFFIKAFLGARTVWIASRFNLHRHPDPESMKVG
jgi:hypothetical protein